MQRLSTGHAPNAQRHPHSRSVRRGWSSDAGAGKSSPLPLLAVFLAAFKDYRLYPRTGRAGDGAGHRCGSEAGADHHAVCACASDRRADAGADDRAGDGGKLRPDQPDDDRGCDGIVSERARLHLGGGICDELAFWRSEDAANPDYEVLAALRPAMVTIPNSILLCASSPYARRGALWDAFCKHFRKNCACAGLEGDDADDEPDRAARRISTRPMKTIRHRRRRSMGRSFGPTLKTSFRLRRCGRASSRAFASVRRSGSGATRPLSIRPAVSTTA